METNYAFIYLSISSVNDLSSHISFVGEHVSSALVAEDPDVEVDLRHPDQSEGGSWSRDSSPPMAAHLTGCVSGQSKSKHSL